MRPDPRTFMPRPLEGDQLDDSGTSKIGISLRADQQSSSIHSIGNQSKQLFQRNTIRECMQKQPRLSNTVDSAQFRISGTSLDTNTGFGTQNQQQSSGVRAKTTHDPYNFVFAEQSCHLEGYQLDSFVHSHSGGSSFSSNHTSLNQSESLPHFSYPNASIQNPTRAIYGSQDHLLANFSIEDHMAANGFNSFVHIDNNHYHPHQDMPPSRLRGCGRGREYFPAPLSIAVGNASSGGDLSISSIVPSTLVSVHLSHSSVFREDETPTRRFSQTNFSNFLPNQTETVVPNEQMCITTRSPSSLSLQNYDKMTIGTSNKSSAVRVELDSYRSLSAPENTPSRLSTYFTAHSRRNRSENYNSYASVHNPAARCTSLLSDFDSGYLGSSQRQIYSEEETSIGDRNRFHTSSDMESNQLLGQTLFPSRNQVSNIRKAPYNLVKTPTTYDYSSDQLASSNLQALRGQLPAFESGFEVSQSMNSTSVNMITNDTSASSDSVRVLYQEMHRKPGNMNQTSIPPTIEDSDVVASENAPPISEHEIGESSVDGVGALGHKGNNKSVKKTRKTRTSEQEDPLWEDQFVALCQFHEKTGHCIVPARYEENKRLGHWVMTQRRQHALLIQGKQSTLNEERVKRLESIGFVWKVRPDASESWSAMFEQMKAYKNKFGDCLVPQRYYPNPQLGTWVHTQRRHYKMRKDGKKSSMTEEKIKNLNSIGFVWSAKVPRKPSVRERREMGAKVEEV